MDTDEDLQLMHKEMQVRRRVLKYFNKCADEFPDEDEYNDYLEMVEDLIANLTNGIDLEKTNAFISKYRKENQDSIARNHARKLEQDRLQADKLALTERRRQQTLEKLHQEDLAYEAAQRAERLQRMRDELERIEHGEEAFRKRKRKERKRAKKLAARKAAAEEARAEAARQEAARAAGGGMYVPSFQRDMAIAPQQQPVNTGPRVVERDEQGPKKEVDMKMRALAGGFSESLVQKRAMLEFHQSLQLVTS